MKKVFSESFYTDDFDQKMLDYLKENCVTTPLTNSEWSKYHRLLGYGNICQRFWTSSTEYMQINNFKYLTKQQFKEKIGMTNKQFTKDMLVAGKHVVRYKEDGELGLIVESAQGKYILFYNGATYASPLEDTDYDQVYTIDTPCGVHGINSNLTLIWQREEKSEAQIKLEQLEEQQRKLADEIAAVRKSL